jgi:hypothetical protein
MLRAALLLLPLLLATGAEEMIRLSDGREVRGEVQADGSVIVAYGTVRAPLNLKGAHVTGRTAAGDELPRLKSQKKEESKKLEVGDISYLANRLNSGELSFLQFAVPAIAYLDPQSVPESSIYVDPYAAPGSLNTKHRLYEEWRKKVSLAKAKGEGLGAEEARAVLAPDISVLRVYEGLQPDAYGHQVAINKPWPCTGIPLEKLKD